jgi:hypothetical protein
LKVREHLGRAKRRGNEVLLNKDYRQFDKISKNGSLIEEGEKPMDSFLIVYCGGRSYLRVIHPLVENISSDCEARVVYRSLPDSNRNGLNTNVCRHWVLSGKTADLERIKKQLLLHDGVYEQCPECEKRKKRATAAPKPEQQQSVGDPAPKSIENALERAKERHHVIHGLRHPLVLHW